MNQDTPDPVDIPLELAGYHLRLSQAQLEGLNNTTSLRLIPSAPRDQATGPWLTGLRALSTTVPDGCLLDLAYASRFDYTGTSFEVADPMTGKALPGRCHFELEGLTVAVPGPWTVSWTWYEQ